MLTSFEELKSSNESMLRLSHRTSRTRWELKTTNITTTRSRRKTSSVNTTLVGVLLAQILAATGTAAYVAYGQAGEAASAGAMTRMINPGDKVNIPCSMVSPGGSVQWVLDNKPILLDFSSTQRRYWNISNDGQAALTINRANKQDEGLWECWELDSMGKVRQKAPIMRIVLTNVPEEPYLEHEGRRLAAQSTITVRENRIISLSCVMKGISSSVRSVEWLVGDQNLTDQSKLMMEYSAEEDVSLTISMLTLNVTSEYHAKVVLCQIRHNSWVNVATLSASFNVLYAPLFSITRHPGFGFPVVEGRPLSLRCEIDSNPPSVAKWERDPDPTISGGDARELNPIETNFDGTLNFTAISKRDIGWYRCTTQHEFGFFASFGYFLNVRSESELGELAGMLGGSSPHIDESDDQPRGHHKEHRKVDALYVPGDGRETFQASVANNPDYGSSNRLTPFDADGKKCGRELEAGRPIIESINSTVLAVMGSQITLNARFCCSPRPKKVFWIHRHLAMMPSRMIGRYITRELVMTSNSMNCFTSSFIIDAVKAEDGGDIMFVVLNAKGVDQAIVSVNVTYASSFAGSNHGVSSSGNPMACHSLSGMLLSIMLVTMALVAR